MIKKYDNVFIICDNVFILFTKKEKHAKIYMKRKKKDMRNLNSYIRKLEKGMEDKLFFLKYIDISEYSLIVEFGCANGRLLRRIEPVVHLDETKLVGFDINEEILDIAKNISKEMTFTSNWDEVLEMLKVTPKKSLIIFSSVWHEIDKKYNETLFEEMKKFTTIVIRDMKAPVQSAEPIDEPTRERIAKRVPEWQFKEFENKWGRIDNKEKLYRFLLMYTYLDNWDNEINEDYFSTPWAEIDWNLEEEYDKVYSSSYTLEYKKEQIEKYFQHTMKDITHHQVVYTRKK